MKREETIERLWQIIQILSSHNDMTSTDLASHFGVSYRTIQRDLERLQNVGVPLEESLGEHGRKYWKLKTVDQILFTYDEVAALNLARPYLEPLFGTFLWGAAETALKKMRDQLGTSAVRNLERLLNIFHNAENNGSPKISVREKAVILETLIMGCEENREICITYQSIHSKEEETYSIRPYELVKTGESVYINGYSCKSHGIRQWKLNRMTAANMTNRKFERPENFHFEPFSSNSTGKIHVVVRFAPEVTRYVQEQCWHESEQLTKNPDGSLLAQYDLSSTYKLKNRILSYGPHAEIIEPASLRREIKNEIENMRLLYQ